ncbi:hypothetical protein ACFU6I_29120 [Streptomyces sp. NPDC057486]|uniref:hypothetical protein n=1 Tax=Streptomyces sp. NPDC057486 TaxID=3346145 RepID=UPI0036B81E6D
MGIDVVGTFDFDEQPDELGRADALTEEEITAVARVEEQGFAFVTTIGDSLVFSKNGGERMFKRILRQDVAEVAKFLGDGTREHENARGIVSSASDYVELVVREARRGGLPLIAGRNRWDQGSTECGHEIAFSNGRSFHISGPGEKACLELSPASATASFLLADGYSVRSAANIGLGYTLKIFFSEDRSGRDLAQEAINLTERLCFELDAAHGIQLVVVPRERFRVTIPRSPVPENGIRVRFPKMQLPREVSALFSFAGEAADNPPFMFLSYYQVLEYHLPLAARREGLKSMRRELQSLNFDEKDDASVLRLLNCAERNRNAGEEDQMKTLVAACVRRDILRDFFDEGGHGDYFTRRGPIAGVPAINVASTSETLEIQVAKRVYALRNRIVHAKDNPKYAETPVLLPRSKEAGLLGPDIHLARLLAVEVVIDSQG